MVEKLDSIPKLFMKKRHRESLSIAVMPELPYRAMGQVLSQIQNVIGENILQLSKLEEPSDARLVLDFMKSDDELFLPLFPVKPGD